MENTSTAAVLDTPPFLEKLPRVGFLGVGWIRKNRMEGLIHNKLVEGITICDSYEPNVQEALKVIPNATVTSSLDELLAQDIDAVVIATPSALHAEQTIRCLQAGKAVFCQKPLGRNLKETHKVVDEARKADKLLAVDYSYRFTQGMQALKKIVNEQELGKIYAVEATFHNAYGPDKPWFYDPKLSGGGCLIDLGSHLVDLILWLFDFPGVKVCNATILAGGKPMINHWEQVEDYVSAELRTSKDISVRLGCSWRLPIGKDAEISLKLYGTKGGAAFFNVNGSFYDFQCEEYTGTATEVLTTPPEEWGTAAIKHWGKELAMNTYYNNKAEEIIKSAAVLEDIYHYVQS